jgi:hypothetical protein
MSGKRLCLAVLAVATILAVSAVAQDEKNEIGGLVGRTFISDQGIQNATYFDPIIHSGKGLTIEGEYARHFWVTAIYSISVEGLLVYNWDVDLNAGEYGHSVVPSDLKKLFVVPAARVNLFPTTAVSPWVSFGAGFGHQRKQSANLRWTQSWQVHDQRGDRGRIRSRCESVEKAQHSRRGARLLGGPTRFPLGSDG